MYIGYLSPALLPVIGVICILAGFAIYLLGNSANYALAFGLLMAGIIAIITGLFIRRHGFPPV